MAEQLNHIGAYVTGTTTTAFFTILLSDNTCGRFMMPSARDVFWMGFTKYKVKDGKLFFKIQNKNSVGVEEFYKEGFNPERLKVKPPSDEPDEFIEATLTPGKEFVLPGERGETSSSSTFITSDVSYWEKLGGFKKLGIARHFEDLKDSDHALEIKKICVEVVRKYGNVFVWV